LTSLEQALATSRQETASATKNTLEQELENLKA
jgi:hypothetical protein